MGTGRSMPDWRPLNPEKDYPGRCACGRPVAKGVERCGACVAKELWGEDWAESLTTFPEGDG